MSYEVITYYVHQPLWPVVYLVGAAFIAALARGFSGFGAALIFVPIASAAVGPQVAGPILLLIDFVAQFGVLKGAIRAANRREVGIMALGALIGIPIGVVILKFADTIVLRWAIAVMIVAMLVLLISGWRYRGQPRRATTAIVGFIAGILSGSVQAAGPPVVAYWLGGSTPPLTVRANIILFFFCTSVVSGVTYLAAGLLNDQVLFLALMTAPGYALGMYLGTRMFNLASERLFRRACYILIGAAAIISLPVLDGVLR
jgi:uncharacterized membrane protein YfcA